MAQDAAHQGGQFNATAFGPYFVYTSTNESEECDIINDVDDN
jgi:hypothetical protein